MFPKVGSLNSDKRIVYLANAANIHTQRWAKHFAKTGWRVFVLSFQDSQIENVEVIHLKTKLGVIGYLSALFEVRKFLRDIKPAILHAHYASGYGLLGSLIAYHPYVISVWGSDVYEFPKRSFIHKSIFKFNMRRADSICSTSHDMAREIGKYSNKEIVVTPFGIDCDEYRPKNKADGNEIIVGTVKKLEEPYGIEYLIKAFSLFIKRHPGLKGVRLVIVGGGILEEKLRRLADEIGISSRVKFVGRVDQDKVPMYLNSFSVYAALSLSESFGVAVLEASACAVPVVVSSVGGLPEVVINNETGFIVPSMDIESAADAIEKLVMDKEMRERMGAAGREFVLGKYQWENNAKIMECLYSTIVGQL